MPNHLPCPFCGSEQTGPAQGSSDLYILIQCMDCGAKSGEVRRVKYYNGYHQPEDVASAYRVWDHRNRLD